MELQGDGIAVTTVSPGFVRTGLADGLDDEHRRSWQAVSYTHLTLPTIYSV